MYDFYCKVFNIVFGSRLDISKISKYIYSV